MWPLELAAGCVFGRGTALITAQVVASSFGSSPKLWLCSVLLCALFVCGGVHFGACCFFLNDFAVVLP
jgi:hypothetical protein